MQQLVREALRVYGRYAEEVIEGFGFCPWAKTARLEGRVRREVVLAERPTIEEVLEVVEAVQADRSAEIGILIFPRLALDRGPFERFVAELRERYAARGDAPERFAMADFHPNAPIEVGSPGRLLSFIRRSPDPVIQLVRLEVLAAVRRAQDEGTSYVDPMTLLSMPLSAKPEVEPLSQRILRANQRTVASKGIEEVASVMESIIEDRHDAYARLGIAAPPWATAPPIE